MLGTSSESVALGKFDIGVAGRSRVSPEASIPAMHLLQSSDLRAGSIKKMVKETAILRTGHGGHLVPMGTHAQPY